MIKRNSVILGLFLVSLLFSTESRIESMGKKDVFFRDDMSIFYNPANIGVLGNFITGSLGFVSDIKDTSYVVTKVYGGTQNGGTVTNPDSVVLREVIENKTATPTNQWFGIVYSQPVNKSISVLFGAAFNRDDYYMDFYNAIRTKRIYATSVFTGDKYLPELKGKSDYILGVKTGNMNFAMSLYSAAQPLAEGGTLVGGRIIPEVELDVSLKKISVGSELGLGENSLEVFGALGMLSISNVNRRDAVYNLPSNSDNSVWLGSRFFYRTTIGGGLTFVPSLRYTSMSGTEAGLDSSYSLLDIGLGMNLRLDGGFFWAGFQGESYTATTHSDSVELSGLGVRFSFGIEKSLIWKWLTVRVGGNKFVAKETIKVKGGSTTEQWVENAVDNGRSDDFLGFGIGLNYQNRLRFDITLNEALPYFNPFGDGLKNSSNGGHMLLRISSTFSL